MTAPKPITVIVEGNIGSGKTTFLKHFQKLPDFAVVDEPISKWRDCQGHNLLELMYKDPQKWSLCFQSYVQLTMLDLHVKPVLKPVKMMERSIFSAKYCFVKNLKDQGLMNDAEYTVLTEWFDFIQETIPLQVDLIVYLKTDPQVVFERIAARGRTEENSITLPYLQSIHKLHEDWLIHKKFGPVPRVVTVDANEDLSKMMTSYSMCEETIIQKVAIANY